MKNDTEIIILLSCGDNSFPLYIPLLREYVSSNAYTDREMEIPIESFFFSFNSARLIHGIYCLSPCECSVSLHSYKHEHSASRRQKKLAKSVCITQRPNKPHNLCERKRITVTAVCTFSLSIRLCSQMTRYEKRKRISVAVIRFSDFAPSLWAIERFVHREIEVVSARLLPW